MSLGGPLLKNTIWGLRIHIDQQGPFLHGDKVIRCLSRRICGLFQIDRCSRHQQLPAASGVFYMADLQPVFCLHMSDKTVGPP